MDKAQIEKLHRLVEFVQQDFEAIISPAEREETLSEAGFLFLAPTIISDTDEGMTEWDIVSRASEDCLTLLHVLSQTAEDGGTVTYNRAMAIQCHTHFDYAAFNQHKWTNWRQTLTCQVHSGETYKTREVEYNGLATVVFDLIDGIPLDRLKICPECQRLFIQKTGKLRKFCSDYCKNKFNIQARSNK